MMDYHSKIEDYNFEGLKDAVMQDARSNEMLARRYTVRLIMLDNFDTFRALRAYMEEIGVSRLQLDMLIGDNPNRWLTHEHLLKHLSNTEKATLVTPFSELVRFYAENEFNGLMHDIILKEDLQHPDKRIYIPLIGLENRIENFLKGFSRIAESGPIWRCHTGRQATRVFLMERAPTENTSHITTLETVQQWLRYWKTDAPQEVIICTAKPIRAFHKNAQPDNIFSFVEIKNIHQLLVDMLGYTFPLEYRDEEEEYWEQIAKEVTRVKAADFVFAKYLSDRFNTLYIDAGYLIRLWVEDGKTPFDRWLLKAYALNDSRFDGEVYLRRCLSECGTEDGEDLLVEIATHVPLHTRGERASETTLAERARLMEKTQKELREATPQRTQEELRDKIVETFEEGDFATAKALCTHTYDFEKRLAAEWFDLHERDTFRRSDLEALYPDLAAYLDEDQTVLDENCRWVRGYFAKYRRAKLADRYDESIAELMKQHNGSAERFFEWYHSFSRSHDKLAQSKVKHVYWVDGLGVEYMPFVQYLVAQHGAFAIAESEYTRADLPTDTKHNRYDLPEENIFRCLDEKGHDSAGYKKYDTLMEELGLLRETMLTILDNHKNEQCRIAIVSDHGMSFLSRKVESLKRDKSAEHEGRFLQCDNSPVNDADYVYHINESDGQQYKVALRHASLGNKPVHEVHGGCTPEEVLTPFLILVPANSIEHFEIHTKTNRILLSNPTIEVYIRPCPASAMLTAGDKETALSHTGGDLWTATIPNAKEGKLKVAVRPEGGLPQTIDIEIQGLGLRPIDDMFN